MWSQGKKTQLFFGKLSCFIEVCTNNIKSGILWSSMSHFGNDYTPKFIFIMNNIKHQNESLHTEQFFTWFTAGAATKLLFSAFPDGPTHLRLNRGQCSQPQLIASSNTFLTTKCQGPQKVGVCLFMLHVCFSVASSSSSKGRGWSASLQPYYVLASLFVIYMQEVPPCLTIMSCYPMLIASPFTLYFRFTPFGI